MRKFILMISGAALAAASFAAPASAQFGGWPADQDAPELVAEEEGYGKDQDVEVEPLADPDDTAILDDDLVEPRRYRPGDNYRGDGEVLDDGRRYCRRSDGTTGAIIGGGAGALIGRGIDTRGRRGTGTILGAIAGALIGSAIERGQDCR